MTESNVSFFNNWDIKANRFVAFIDIIGFQDLVAKKSHDEVFYLMTFLSEALKKFGITFNEGSDYERKYIHITSFSDSIIIFTDTDNHVSFHILTWAVSNIFAESLRKSISMKGAIAHGEISVDYKNNIYFGQPIIDAYKLQENVKYFGLVAHHSIDNYLINSTVDSSNINNYFIELPTPLKDTNRDINHLNLNWLRAYFYNHQAEILDTNHTILNYEEWFKDIISLIKNFKTSSTGYHRMYLENTLKLIESF